MKSWVRRIFSGCFASGGVMMLFALITYDPLAPSCIFEYAPVRSQEVIHAMVAHIAALGYYYFGYTAWTLPVFLFCNSWACVSQFSFLVFVRVVGALLLIILSSSFEHLVYAGGVPGSLPGGSIGAICGAYAMHLGPYAPSILLLLAAFLLLFLDGCAYRIVPFLYHSSVRGLIYLVHCIASGVDFCARWSVACGEYAREIGRYPAVADHAVYQIFSDPFYQHSHVYQNDQVDFLPEKSEPVLSSVKGELGQCESYKTPAELCVTGDADFLFTECGVAPDAEEVAQADADAAGKADIITQKLRNFGIEGHVVSITTGPVVTLFQYKPAAQTKISALLARHADVALALGGMPVRIIAPLPGKGAVGFEVARRKRVVVPLRDLLALPEFCASTGLLPVILGKDVAGELVIADLASMPHLLMAGSTGSGKSVGLNGFIISLLWRHSPARLKLVLIDPKRLEFGPYADIPHLLYPIVTDTDRIVPTLQGLVNEMEKRYALLAEKGVRDIQQFHEQDAHDADDMPWIVVIIDELADIMMTAGKQAEQHIARLAQMARAAGIHLIVATQRPSVDVITGLIKVNFPTRISFSLTTKGDSRTVLGRHGAESLLGKGDALYLDGSGSLMRVHCAYMSPQEIHTILDMIKQQQKPHYSSYAMNHQEKDSNDPLFAKVKTFVLSQETISISQLQRTFSIGFNRSARIVQKLEEIGYLGPPLKSKHRAVKAHRLLSDMTRRAVENQ